MKAKSFFNGALPRHFCRGVCDARYSWCLRLYVRIRQWITRLTEVVLTAAWVLLGSLLSLNTVLADSSDPLAGVKDSVKAMFGGGSTVSYCIYIAEITLGAIGYMKTKNLLLLLGGPILVAFTKLMYVYIG